MARNITNNNQVDHGFVPWVLLLTVFSLWALSKLLSNIFGRNRNNHHGAVATPVANPAYGNTVATPATTTTATGAGWGNNMYKPNRYITEGLETLLWLLLIPTVINELFGFHDETVKKLLIAVFSMGLIWAVLRGLGHLWNFLHRLVDWLLIFIFPLAIAAAVLGLRRKWGDD